jgi:hypothetical protein
MRPPAVKKSRTSWILRCDHHPIPIISRKYADTMVQSSTCTAELLLGQTKPGILTEKFTYVTLFA